MEAVLQHREGALVRKEDDLQPIPPGALCCPDSVFYCYANVTLHELYEQHSWHEGPTAEPFGSPRVMAAARRGDARPAQLCAARRRWPAHAGAHTPGLGIRGDSTSATTCGAMAT